MTVTSGRPTETETEPPPAAPGGEPRRLSPPWTPRRVTLTGIGVGFVAMALWSLWDIGVNPLTLWFERDDIGSLLGRMWPPRIDEPELVWDAALDTFFMAFVGTALGVMLALPLAFLAARNVTSNPLLRGGSRAIIVVTRAIPELVFALIFVRVYSIGVLPGIVALGLHSIGMLGKLFADTIEQIAPGPREGVQATGAGRFQELGTGIVPQVVPAFIAITLYRLDINFRSATLLGLVGAGGIGLQIRAHQGSLDYEQLLGVTLVIVVLIVIVELVSTNVRSIILGHDKTKVGFFQKLRGGPPAADYQPAEQPLVEADGELPTGPAPARLSPPWTKERVTMYLFGAVSVVFFWLSFTVTGVSFTEFLRGLPEIPEVFVRIIPNDMSWWQPMFGDQLVETVAMGFAATFLALVFAVPTGYLAARNVAPFRWIYVTARAFILGVRALPDLIVAVIFVAALGLGPKPGVLALAIGLYGFATKLFADSIEEVLEGPRDGVRATGATRLQESLTSVTPQAMPSIIGNSLYLLDVSIRASTVLGIVGAGGIGFALLGAARLLEWDLLGGLLIIIFLIVYGIELLAAWVRKQVI